MVRDQRRESSQRGVRNAGGRHCVAVKNRPPRRNNGTANSCRRGGGRRNCPRQRQLSGADSSARDRGESRRSGHRNRQTRSAPRGDDDGQSRVSSTAAPSPHPTGQRKAGSLLDDPPRRRPSRTPSRRRCPQPGTSRAVHSRPQLRERRRSTEDAYSTYRRCRPGSARGAHHEGGPPQLSRCAPQR